MKERSAGENFSTRSTASRMKQWLLTPLFLFFSFSLGGCSLLGDGISEDAKVTVLRVTQTYLATVVLGDETKLGDQIAWEDFLGHGDKKISHAEFSRELQLFNRAYSPRDPKNPLLGLKVRKITGSGNSAEVRLEKADGSSSEVISVRLAWTGSGWIIMEDSLFGTGKFISRLVNSQK